MKFFLTIAVSFFLATASLAQQATDPMQDPTALAKTYLKAMLDEDAGTIGKIITGDFVISSFDGQSYDGDLLQQGIGGGFVTIETGEVQDARSRVFNNDAAITTGFWKVKGSIQGEAINTTAAFAIVSTKQGNGWKIAHVQFTPSK